MIVKVQFFKTNTKSDSTTYLQQHRERAAAAGKTDKAKFKESRPKRTTRPHDIASNLGRAAFTQSREGHADEEKH
jgi:hypothetical protein